jgi:hypothetical protein
VHQCIVGYYDEATDAYIENVMCCEYDEARPEDARVRHNYGEDNEPTDWGDWGPYGEGWYQ